MIEIPAVIDKADIEPIGKMRGAVNSDTATLLGREFGPSELVFRGFAGAYDKASRKWVGVYRFENAVGGEDAGEMCIAALPNRGSRLHVTERVTLAAETEINDNGI